MSLGRSHVGVLLVSLALGTAVGCKRPPEQGRFSSPYDPCLVPGSHVVQVGPNENTLSCPIVVIRSTNSIVTWNTSPANQDLSIRFPRSGFPKGITVPPFQNMVEDTTGGNADFYFPNAGSSTTTSTAINPALLKTSPHGQADYAYDQILNSKRSDGRIIINW
jgi:hypothetical protein